MEGASSAKTGKDRKWLAGAKLNPHWELEVPLRYRLRKHAKLLDRSLRHPEALRRSKEKPPTLKDRAIDLAKQKGIVTADELKTIGISRHYLSRMCALGFLERYGPCQYGLPRKDVA
ncbi:type IV toxin-antitoxin system AbiEi family antitoxin domain-containing protein [Sphingopyxis indica]|uniref:type IV toxin-antitoxin system AbiEi family antitoxin domain-containing protein n=1 Tax=Sphingopyxis indica TaxID=436663 RepID=UPI0011324FDC